MKKKIIKFYDIKFHNTSFQSIYNKINKGGYLVAPAASSLSKIFKKKKYFDALVKADIAILDSGFFCILLRVFKGLKVNKLSGYLFLKKFLEKKYNKNIKFLLIDPNITESKLNKQYLKNKKIYNVITYVAPFYNYSIIDKKLLKLIKKEKPKYIIINIGGETQEVLANYLYNNVRRKTSILCTGAAIAFLTKKQAPINDLIDRLYLGWFVRLLHNPLKYTSRILSSFHLLRLFLK